MYWIVLVLVCLGVFRVLYLGIHNERLLVFSRPYAMPVPYQNRPLQVKINLVYGISNLRPFLFDFKAIYRALDIVY